MNCSTPTFLLCFGPMHWKPYDQVEDLVGNSHEPYYIEAQYGVYWAITNNFVLTVLTLHCKGGSSKLVLIPVTFHIVLSYLNGPFQFGAQNSELWRLRSGTCKHGVLLHTISVFGFCMKKGRWIHMATNVCSYCIQSCASPGMKAE